MTNTDKVKAQNEIWVRFKKQYKQLDLNISNKFEYIHENDVNDKCKGLSDKDYELQIQAHVNAINHLRSAQYHKARHEAFEKREALNNRIKRLNEIDADEKEERERAIIGRRLRGFERKMFKKAGILPQEFKLAVLEVLGNVASTMEYKEKDNQDCR